MEQYTCKQCKESYESYPSQAGSFCSVECSNEWKKEAYKGENNHFHKEKESVECSYCAEIYQVQPHRVGRTKYCSKDCQMSALNENKSGENHPNYKEKPKVECNYCESKFEVYPHKKNERKFCSDECNRSYISEYRVGENHPRWKDEEIEFYYGSKWDKMRRKALQRDNFECVVCKRGKEELGQRPDVHHITSITEFENVNDAHYLDNLISLCRKHHKMIEGWGLKPSNL